MRFARDRVAAKRRSPRLLALLALSGALLAAWVIGPPAADARGRFGGSAPAAVPPGAVLWRLATLPLGGWCGALGGSGAEEAPAEAVSLARGAGWTPLGFPVRDSGLGLVVQLRGRAELGTVEIVFEDGELERLYLARSRTYGDGLYELASFERERRVMVVRLAARARSKQASFRILLLREAPAAS